MKQEIRDIKDITYSRELYEARPKPWVSAFVYIILAFFVITLLFLAFFQIDVVIKAVGVVRPNRQVSTGKALKSGEIIEVHYEEGQEVRQGEILLVLDYSQQQIAQNQIKEELLQKQKEIAQIEKYIIALKTGENVFNEETEPLYYSKFEKFKWNQIVNKEELNYGKEITEMESKSLQKDIEDLGKEIYDVEKLLVAIESGNHFTGTTNYYLRKLEKYKLDYDALKRQYDDKIFEVENSQTLIYSQRSLFDVELNLYGNQKIREALMQQKEEIIFEEAEKFSLEELEIFQKQYQEYRNQKKQLEENFQSAEKNYELYKSLEKLATTKNQVEEAQKNMQKSKLERDNFISEYSRNITKTVSELELQLLQLQFQNQKEISKETLLENIKEAKDKALKKLTRDEIVVLQEQLKNDQRKQRQLQFALEKAKIESTKNRQNEYEEEYTNILYLKKSEIFTALENREKLQESVRELETRLATVEREIDNSVMIASQSGRINIITEMVVGDQILAGTEVFTIVPEENTTYKVQILVNNQDIAKVKVGDNIKYHFQALPQKEFGNLTGEVLKISTDTKYDTVSKGNYYSVEASLNEKEVYSYKGEKAKVKIGMINEARIISEQKSILRFLLEKINLLD